jgi:hypothetical protein
MQQLIQIRQIGTNWPYCYLQHKVYSNMDQIKNISECQCAIEQSESTVNLKTGSVKIINKKSRINIKMNQFQKTYNMLKRLRILFT